MGARRKESARAFDEQQDEEDERGDERNARALAPLAVGREADDDTALRTRVNNDEYEKRERRAEKRAMFDRLLLGGNKRGK